MELEIYLKNTNLNPDVILITEHWLRTDNINLLQTLPRFKLAGYYSRDMIDRGGSCILLCDHINYINRHDIAQIAELINFEVACIEIKDSMNIVILVIYRTPSSNLEVLFEKLEMLLDKLHHESTKKKIVIGGDFNVNMLGKNENKDKERLTQLMESYNMYTNFTEPTRITPNSATCIDNIFTNFVTDNCKIIETCLSDHTAQVINFTLPSKMLERGKKTILRRKFQDYKISQFNKLLQQQDWSPVYIETCRGGYESDFVNASYNAFASIFYSCFETAFPKIPTKQKQNIINKNWITKGIIKSSETKMRLFKNMRLYGDKKNTDIYNTYKKCYVKVIKAAKKLANNKYILSHSNKSAAAWQVVNNEMGRSKPKIDIDKVKLNGKEIIDPLKIASMFNSYFITVTDHLHKAIDSNLEPNILYNVKEGDHKLVNFDLTNEREVILTVNSLKNSNSSGWDEVNSKL